MAEVRPTPPSPSDVNPARLAATRYVTKGLAEHRIRVALSKVATADGMHPIVVALPEDSIQEVFNRIPAEGIAHVVVVGEEEMVVAAVGDLATLALSVEQGQK